MAGHLQTHPYYRTWDEVQRSTKRMQHHLDTNRDILPTDEQEAISILIESLETALKQVPEKYRLTKHHQRRRK